MRGTADRVSDGAARCRGLARVLLCTALLGCASGDPEAGPPRGAVLVVIDTLRADHLGAYGYARPTSPRIDAFAGDATLFRNAVSPSPWTMPAVATLMTSLHPSVHGARYATSREGLEWSTDPSEIRAADALHPSRTTLAEILAGEGFATAAFVRGAYVSRAFGMAQGFERFSDNDRPGIRFQIEGLLDWLDAHGAERFFAYLHVLEVHAPYEATGPLLLDAFEWPAVDVEAVRPAIAEERERYLRTDFDPGYSGPVTGSRENLEALGARPRLSERDLRHLVALYDREIAYVDYWIGRLLDGLRERELYDDAVIVLTSDHGEEFLEHSGLEHGYSYFEEMLRVPLVVRVPSEGTGRSVGQQVGLVDLLPTLLEALGLPPVAPVQGRSILPLLRGEDLPARPQLGEASMVVDLAALRTNEWKYVKQKDTEALFDLRADPGETVNRCREEAASCRFLRRRFRALRREGAALAAELPAAEPARPGEEDRERLRALGYAD